MNVTSDTLFSSLMIIISGQIDILQYRMKEIGGVLQKYKSIHLNNNSNFEMYNNIVNNKIYHCIQHHHEINRYYMHYNKYLYNIYTNNKLYI